MRREFGTLSSFEVLHYGASSSQVIEDIKASGKVRFLPPASDFDWAGLWMHYSERAPPGLLQIRARLQNLGSVSTTLLIHPKGLLRVPEPTVVCLRGRADSRDIK